MGSIRSTSPAPSHVSHPDTAEPPPPRQQLATRDAALPDASPPNASPMAAALTPPRADPYVSLRKQYPALHACSCPNATLPRRRQLIDLTTDAVRRRFPADAPLFWFD